MMKRTAVLVLLGLFLVPAQSQDPSGDRRVDFVRDIRPIFRQHCYKCHSGEKPDGKMRLDVKPSALKRASNKIIIPGNSGRSRLVRFLLESDPELRMPQDADALEREKIDLIRKWIDQGAEWPESDSEQERWKHWAYRKPVRHDLPKVKDEPWVRNPIDAFVLARLEAEGLSPSTEATREKLIRRASLDLTGLPPTIEEVDAFLADKGSDAYEKLVDRLLASPHYGERWARPWLDLARYADTHGYEKDVRRSMWKYRDWVIQALNADMSFRQFTIEQIAGDMLSNATRNQRIATGFHRNTMINEEGGVDRAEARWETLVDRVGTTATVWLGTTLACAQCHDHKYDPFSQKEFYQLLAFFENAREPRIEIPTPEQAKRRDELLAEISRLEMVLKSSTPELEEAQAQWAAELEKILKGWQVLEPESFVSSGGATLTAQKDGSILAGGTNPDTDRFTVKARTDLQGITAFRLEVLADKSLPSSGPGRAPNGDFMISEFSVQTDAPVRLFRATADFSPGSARIERAIDGKPATGWSVGPQLGRNHLAIFETRPRPIPVKPTPEGYRLKVAYNGIGDDRVGTKQQEPDGAKDHAIEVSGLADKEVAHVEIYDGQGRHWRTQGAPRWYCATEKTEEGLNVAFARTTNDLGRYYTVKVTYAEGGEDMGFFALKEPDPPPVGGEGGTLLTIVLDHQSLHPQHVIGRFRISATTTAQPERTLSVPAHVRTMLLSPEEKRTGLAAYYRSIAPLLKPTRNRIAHVRRQITALKIPTTLVMEERATFERPSTPLRIRGSFLNKGETVFAGVPAILHPLPGERLPNRLGLAHWLVDEENPLTARVFVNRAWEQIFGRGLLKTSEDFGTRAAPPTHPKLLDWLATEFMRGGWSMKKLHRLIVTSATYRQSSRVTPALLEKDPSNLLLARAPRIRMEAEMIRDTALAAGGLLSRKIGGPSVFPPQPPGIWNIPYNSDRWRTSVGEDRYRRGLYTFWRRSAAYPAFTIFDAPSREFCTVRRARTNTPLQALTLLNDPAYFEAARGLARAIVKGAKDARDRATLGFRRCVSRRPDEAELEALLALHEKQLQRYTKDPAAAAKVVKGMDPAPAESEIPELAAWTVVANAMLNLDETVTKE